tara:strand:- start:910 stop:1149 length:240 start_codon:yes stop_codon:yes gene_type:complete
MLKSTIDGLLSSPEFMQKVAAKYPNAVTTNLGSKLNMTGDLHTDLAKVAFTLGSTSYTQRKERAIINTGLMALSELENG